MCCTYIYGIKWKLNKTKKATNAEKTIAYAFRNFEPSNVEYRKTTPLPPSATAMAEAATASSNQHSLNISNKDVNNPSLNSIYS